MLLFVLDAEVGTGWDQESEAATAELKKSFHPPSTHAPQPAQGAVESMRIKRHQSPALPPLRRPLTLVWIISSAEIDLSDSVVLGNPSYHPHGEDRAHHVRFAQPRAMGCKVSDV